MTVPIAPARRASPLFTLEDAKISFSIVCCVCGIGTLSMPSNFARAGPVFAALAMVLMAFANIYATVALSKVMLVAPTWVQTFGDVGDWVFGRAGRYAVVISQLLVCLLLPCAFLVLGSSLLAVLFPDSFSDVFWIIFMAVTTLGVVLIPTLKEAAGVAFIGCLGTIIADVVGVSVLQYEMRGHPTPPSPDVTLHQVLTTFGNLSLAYGAAVLIPDLQRQHSQPQRMPRVIMASLGLGSAFFVAVGVTGYVAGGCQLSSNLLFSIVNLGDPSAPSALGFTASRGAILMAYLFMHVHVTIVISTVLMPPFYIFERLLLRMHKGIETVRTDEEGEKLSLHGAASPVVGSTPIATADLESNYAAATAMVPTPSTTEDSEVEDAELSEYSKPGNAVRYISLRIAIMVVLVAASVGFRDHFTDLVDFTGSSAITVCCLVLPLVFYLKVFWPELPLYERVASLLIILVCAAVGCYVMIYAGKNLFNPGSESATFPYCSAEYQSEPFYVRNATASD